MCAIERERVADVVLVFMRRRTCQACVCVCVYVFPGCCQCLQSEEHLSISRFRLFSVVLPVNVHVRVYVVSACLGVYVCVRVCVEQVGNVVYQNGRTWDSASCEG